MSTSPLLASSKSRLRTYPFTADGEMALLTAEFDWARTSLGAPEQWPAPLKIAVQLMLSSGFPTVVMWGSELVMLYNDAYAALIGERHPRALGMPTHQCWPETQAFHEDVYARVFAGETVHLVNTPLRTTRYGLPDDAFFTLSYIPLLNDDETVGGVQVVLIETTDQVQASRMSDDRERALAAEHTARARAEQLQRITATLARAQTMFDVATLFSRELTTLLGADTAWVGVVNEQHTFVEALGHSGYVDEVVLLWERMPLEPGVALVDAVLSAEPQWWETQEQLVEAYPARRKGIATAAQESIAVLPLLGGSPRHASRDSVVNESAANTSAFGGIVIGFHERQHFDSDTRAFFQALAQQCSQAIVRARAYESERSARLRADTSRARTERLLEMSLALSRGMSSHEIARIISHEGRSIFSADGSSVFTIDEDGKALVLLAHTGITDESTSAFRTINVDTETPLAEVARTGEAIFVETREAIIARFSGMAESVVRAGRHAFACVPLRVEGHVVGVLGFVFDSPRFFSDDDRIFAEVLAQQCAQALERTRLFEAEHDARRRAEVLQAVTAALSAAESIPDVATAALQAAINGSDATTGTAALVSHDGKSFEKIAHCGPPHPAFDLWKHFPSIGEYPASDVVQTGKAQFLASGAEYGARYPQLQSVLRSLSIEASAVLPLTRTRGGAPVGYISLHYPEPHAFPAGEVTFLSALAQVTAQALERARLFEAEQLARAEAEDARAAAEAANLAKSQFLATMSHELRTPLNAIGGYAELIELGIHGPVTEAQRTALARIQWSQTHLLSLINEVLNYARLEAGVVQYNLSSIAVTEAISNVSSLIQPQVHTKGLHLVVDSIPAHYIITADREKLSQVLLNLLSNALKFTSAGGRITITSRLLEGPRPARKTTVDGDTADNGTFIEISVHDTGIGISADQIEHIFEPFVQVGRTLSSPHEGTGLGLAISRDLARGMGGDLFAESMPGVGSTFQLVLRAG